MWHDLIGKITFLLLIESNKVVKFSLVGGTNTE